MAEDKPRAPRARKKASDTDAATTKVVAKKKPATTTSRRRKSDTTATQPGDVAIRAYYLWELGEPGDADEHWLRAEQELAAA